MIKKKFLVIIFLLILLILFKKYDVFSMFGFEKMEKLKEYINSFGVISPIIFIGLFIMSTIFFVPGLPITILSGILFGALWGTLYVIIGSSIGVSVSFLIGRYLGRDFIKKTVDKNERMRKLDNYIKEEGNTILIVSRLIPIFPFNLQNYAYGITDISFKTYFLYSFIFMIPGTFIYTSFGALAYSSMSIEKLILYSSLLLISLCLLIVIPRRILSRWSKL